MDMNIFVCSTSSGLWKKIGEPLFACPISRAFNTSVVLLIFSHLAPG